MVMFADVQRDEHFSFHIFLTIWVTKLFYDSSLTGWLLCIRQLSALPSCFSSFKRRRERCVVWSTVLAKERRRFSPWASRFQFGIEILGIFPENCRKVSLCGREQSSCQVLRIFLLGQERISRVCCHCPYRCDHDQIVKKNRLRMTKIPATNDAHMKIEFLSLADD